MNVTVPAEIVGVSRSFVTSRVDATVTPACECRATDRNSPKLFDDISNTLLNATTDFGSCVGLGNGRNTSTAHRCCLYDYLR
jgi:hypothetical protein